ncbi:hypothetical protein [Aurantibacter aestuarii]|uniref:Aspartate kinase n=1 Tax=Aurantibacter aestuarii TaxID=1266046 RepID=A0A2T1NCH9_9FLAO|nr:hypothetical protein [Aurantibacter aestuarii]PSG90148.1 hypothetical protein C7H52_02405 [Aurantibacter aestuarii]
MKTITFCVEELLKQQPFLEEALSRGIINYSALAEELIPEIGKRVGKPVKSGAIMMALRRYSIPQAITNTNKLKQIIMQLGDITVRSNLTDFTYKNSSTLIDSHAKILNLINKKTNIFYAFTRGIHESNLIITTQEKENVISSFKGEILLESLDKLSAISIQLPENNTRMTGLYYHIFKLLAWEGISIYEMVSTTNEFTLLFEDMYIDKAFKIISRLKEI